MDLIQRDLRVFCVFAFLLCCGLVASDNAAPAVLEPELRPVDVNQTTEETHGILGMHRVDRIINANFFLFFDKKIVYIFVYSYRYVQTEL